ncbi:pyocin activator PrtN family protein [Neorhizobium lilium]|uniref:pyocin activator PrtN family protein n=1 Tax=Neorhizobium lilium TaxID=2503024 RepID=UPI001FE01064|nr:pyocin activator PrtN family protein [Neorhizobium lilium]
MASYNGTAIIPVVSVVKDYFPHVAVESFPRKASVGEIKLPVVRIEPSHKAREGRPPSGLSG